MLEGIRKAFKDHVSEVGWIDSQTVKAVKEKVSETRIVRCCNNIQERQRNRQTVRPTDRLTKRLVIRVIVMLGVGMSLSLFWFVWNVLDT